MLDKCGEKLPKFVKAAVIEVAILLSFILLGAKVEAIVLRDEDGVLPGQRLLVDTALGER